MMRCDGRCSRRQNKAMSEVQQDELPGLKPTPASDSHSELRSNRSGNADKLSRFF